MPFIHYRKTPVHYKLSGNGPLLVLLHGFLEEESMWDELTPHLSKSFQCLRVDLLGHGKTGNLGYIHRMEDQADMVDHLMTELELSSGSFIGHSMGGYICLALLEKYPDRVNKLCLMNSTAMADSDEKKVNRDRGIAAVKQNHRTFIRLAIPNLFSDDNRQKFKNEIEKVIEKALTMTPQGIVASLEGMKIRKDRTSFLKEFASNSLLIIAREDPALDFDSLIKLATMSHLKHTILEGGHMSHFENKESLLQAFDIFL